jgi:hypothetical protein
MDKLEIVEEIKKVTGKGNGTQVVASRKLKSTIK